MIYRPLQTPADLDTDGLRSHSDDQFREVERAWTEVDQSLTDLGATKVAKAGDTMTGNLSIVSGSLFLQGFGGSTNQGIVRFNAAQDRYLYYDGSNYFLNGASLYTVNGRVWGSSDGTPLFTSGGTMSGVINTAVSGSIGTGGPLPSIVVDGATGDWAAMTFYSPGYWGGNFGMHPNGNFYMGGWSYGAGVTYQFWTSRDGSMVTDGRLPYAGDAGIPSYNAYVDYLAHALVSGSYTSSANGLTFGHRMRYVQGFRAGAWFTFPHA